VNLGALREAKPRDVALRFVFGALISAVAGLVGKRFGQHAGGLFLAFPAVLPAALTFIEKKDGEQAVHGEAIGAVPGFERLRDRARALKHEVMEHLDLYLEQFAGNVDQV